MTKFYEKNEDGSVGRFTDKKEVAAAEGLTLTTDGEIVFSQGRYYLEGDVPKPVYSFVDYDNAMEAHLDEEKAERGYTKREPTDYANSGVARFKHDADDWSAHRDAVMLYGLEVENKAKRGEPVPTLDEFKAALPVIKWTFKGDSTND